LIFPLNRIYRYIMEFLIIGGAFFIDIYIHMYTYCIYIYIYICIFMFMYIYILTYPLNHIYRYIMEFLIIGGAFFWAYMGLIVCIIMTDQDRYIYVYMYLLICGFIFMYICVYMYAYMDIYMNI
jgi:hypothetical protein